MTDTDEPDEIIKGKGRYNVKILAGWCESQSRGAKGQILRGKRISLNGPCPCEDCARGVHD